MDRTNQTDRQVRDVLEHLADISTIGRCKQHFFHRSCRLMYYEEEETKHNNLV